MLQMAEILYQSTAFESALVYFSRGRKVRPTSNDFILGVTKSKAAISKAVGEPKRVKFVLSDEAKDGIRNPSEVFLSELPNELLDIKHEPQLSDKDFQHLKRLMGKSCEAVQHFQQLSSSEERYETYLKNSKEISELAAEAYRYLRVRSEFWRQQEPMYNRVKKCRRKTGRKVSSKDDVNALQRLVHMLQDISTVQHAGDHSKALQLCAALREDIKVLNPDFTALTEVMADLHAFEAVSNFHLQNYKEARDGFLAQLETCRNANLQHHIPRCLENLGRAYAKLENYQAAKEVWTERLQYEMTGADRSWLHFELGLCNIELSEYEEAVVNGLACKKGSEREFDMNWELKACVLIAQAHLALNNLNEAQTYFQNAQYTAYVLNNQKLEELLASALEEVEAAIEENERKTVEEEYGGFGTSDEDSKDQSGAEEEEEEDEEDWEDLWVSESTLPSRERSEQEPHT
ncbi:Tetratricopeptide repeat protein 25 [Taenia crassiceps]|uniref:Outer dynein arm-docking complex subunit 4 n=1 Tax=Taenia crassiceps TaxID=6207 RepID=A0ABR4QGV7_9CEST